MSVSNQASGAKGESDFQFPYIPNTPEEQAGMLATLGLGSIAELFHDIPEVYRDPPLNLPGPTSELEVQRELAL